MDKTEHNKKVYLSVYGKQLAKQVAFTFIVVILQRYFKSPTTTIAFVLFNVWIAFEIGDAIPFSSWKDKSFKNSIEWIIVSILTGALTLLLAHKIYFTTMHLHYTISLLLIAIGMDSLLAPIFKIYTSIIYRIIGVSK